MLKKIAIALFSVLMLSGCMSDSESSINTSSKKRVIIKDDTTGTVSNIYEYENSKLSKRVYLGTKFQNPTTTDYSYNEEGLLSKEEIKDEKTGERECVSYKYDKPLNTKTKSTGTTTDVIKRISSKGEEVVYHIGYENGEIIGVVEENKSNESVISKEF